MAASRAFPASNDRGRPTARVVFFGFILIWMLLLYRSIKNYESLATRGTSVLYGTETEVGNRKEHIMGKLEGKVAVITGGSSGIGLATAQRFVAEGAQVFITGRRQSELDKAVKLIGKNVTGVQGDVANLADLDRLYATVKEQKRRVDVLFANAGVGEYGALGEITEEHFDKIFAVNVRGLVFS